MLPDTLIVDDALSPGELAWWQERVQQTVDASTALSADELKNENVQTMLARCREKVGDLALLHVLLFRLEGDHYTEMHNDVGEYVVLFYPFTNAQGPLRTDLSDTLVDVRENRLIFLNCMAVMHQQVVPPDGSTRYSVAFKFRLLE